MDADPNDEAVEGFVHEPLSLSESNIRVLTISPGEEGDPINCRLQHVRRSRNQYVCLSYMWGDDGDCQSIIVNGKQLHVRPTLLSFLVLARQLVISDCLWIDAVSIDQTNTTERNHQVQQMAPIYREAKHVLIYPGPLPRSLIRAMSLAHRDPQRSKYGWGFKWNGIMCQVLKDGLKKVGQMPYWNRVWIAQENLLAQARFLVTEIGLIHWNDFYPLYSVARSRWLSKRRRWSHAWEIQQWHLGRLEGYYGHEPGTRFLPAIKETMPTVLSKFDEAQGSDTRDRIYSLLGLVEGAEGFRVDYMITLGALLLDTVEHFTNKSSYDPYTTTKFIDTLSRSLQVHVRYICSSCTRKYILPLHVDGSEIEPGWYLIMADVQRDTPCPANSLLPKGESPRCGLCSEMLPKPPLYRYKAFQRSLVLRISADKILCHYRWFGYSDKTRGLSGKPYAVPERLVKRIREHHELIPKINSDEDISNG